MAATSPPLSRQQLLAIAPTSIQVPEGERYRGDTVTCSLAGLPPDDQETVQQLYDFLIRVYGQTKGHLHQDDGGIEVLAALAGSDSFDGLVDRVARIGVSLHADDVSMEVKQSLHDIRGGSLLALIMHLDMALEGDALPEDAQRVFLLARDHLKMMRNAVHDLDVDRYNADLAERAHSIDLLREKWNNVVYKAGASATKIGFFCDFDGAVSQRCMEFSALDRVIYNLVNNASQHAADGRVDLMITSVDDSASTHLRFAVVNKVSDAQRAALQERFGDDLSALFRGGFTTGGHGIGMRVCGDFVTQGYGRSSLDAALSDKLLGVDLVDDLFVAWFHWPAERLHSVRAAK